MSHHRVGSAGRRAWLATSLVAWAAVFAAGCQIGLGADVEVREAWNRTYTVRADGTLEIEETNAGISIESHDADSIDVEATRVVKATSEEAAKAALAEFTVRDEASADRLRLSSNHKTFQLALGLNRRVDYSIKVPRGVSVAIDITNGEVEVRNLSGTLRVSSTNGRIRATGLGGGANVEATNGDVRLDLDRLSDAGVRCRTTNGKITVTLPADARATIAAQVVNGSIQTENLALERSGESRRRLEATMGGGGAPVRLETVNGLIQIRGR